MEMKVCKWIERKDANVRIFQLECEPELIYIIKSGHDDTYIVVYEDAYQLTTGKTIIASKEFIENKFNIKL